MKQRKRFDKTFICNSVSSCTVCLIYIQYSHTFSISKQINLSKKNKGQQKLYDVNVRAICGCRKAGRHQTLMKKRKFWQDICKQLQCLFILATHFSPRNRLIYQRKTKDVNVRAIYGCREAGRHQKLLKKRKVWLDIYNSVSLFVYIVTYFLPQH